MKSIELEKLLDMPHLSAHLTQFEQALKASLKTKNTHLYMPARRVLSGGKRLRPILVMAVAAAAGKKIDKTVLAAASAIELLHIASLVHDDIIDQANTRRGIATISATEGVDQAILVGDYLLATALAQAAGVGQAAALTAARAFAAMCEGQAQEVADSYKIRSVDTYLETIHQKTAALMAAACRLGGLCAGLPESQLKALDHYGEAFSMAFQLTDDLLDFLSSEEALGKPVGNDLKEGVYTLPILLSLQGPSGATVKSWLGPKTDDLPDHSEIVEILHKDGSFVATLERIREYNAIARQALDPQFIGLAKLPDAYLQAALQKQKLI